MSSVKSFLAITTKYVNLLTRDVTNSLSLFIQKLDRQVLSSCFIYKIDAVKSFMRKKQQSFIANAIEHCDESIEKKIEDPLATYNFVFHQSLRSKQKK